MPPQSEPSVNDVAMVAAAMTGAPQPQAPAPAPVEQQPAPQLQPEPAVQQPAPSQSQTDPFASLFASEPTADPVSQPAPQPTAPVEPVAPVEAYNIPQPQAPQPVAPAAPVAQGDDYQTYEEYMNQVLAGVPAAPVAPDPESIDQNDPAAIKGFFDELMNTAVARAQAETAKATAIQNSEKRQWDAAFDKYGSLKTNKDLRDMVHNIRMANFQRGVAMTPTQAAEKLLTSLGAQYNKGVADNQVITTYEQVQPNGGGTGVPVPTTLDRDNALTAVQTGGETALAAILDAQIKAGKTW